MMNQNKFYCQNFGNELIDGSHFCTKCGVPCNNDNNINRSIQINNNSNVNFGNNQIKQEFNVMTISGIACGIVSLFIFWWLALLGLSWEIKTIKDIKEKNQKGKIVAYIGVSLCGSSLIMYLLVNILATIK